MDPCIGNKENGVAGAVFASPTRKSLASTTSTNMKPSPVASAKTSIQSPTKSNVTPLRPPFRSVHVSQPLAPIAPIKAVNDTPGAPSVAALADCLNQSLVGRDEVEALETQVDMLKQQLLAFDLKEQQNQRAVELMRSQIDGFGAKESEWNEKENAWSQKEQHMQQIEAQLRKEIAALEANLTSLQTIHASLQQQHAQSKDVQNYMKLHTAHEALNTEHTKTVRQFKVAIAAANHTTAVWVRANTCAQCKKDFTLFHRRHHCRRCGDSVCSSCSVDKSISLGPSGKKPVRACNECLKEAAAEKAKKMASANANIRSRAQSISIAVPAAPPMAPPMAVPCAPPMAPPVAPDLSTSAADAVAPLPCFTSPRASVNSSVLSSVTLRRTPSHSASKQQGGGRDNILADIKSFHKRQPGSGLKKKASPRTIAKTTSPNQHADQKTPSGRKSPVDMMSQLRSSIRQRRQHIEYGSDHKSVSASARKNQPTTDGKTKIKAKRELLFGASSAQVVDAVSVAVVAAPVDSDDAVIINITPIITNAIKAEDAAPAAFLSPSRARKIEDVEDHEWQD